MHHATPRHSDRVPLTPDRLYRLQRKVVLSEAAHRADLSTFRASTIERDPARARPGELESLRAAIDEIHAERGQELLTELETVLASESNGGAE